MTLLLILIIIGMTTGYLTVPKAVGAIKQHRSIATGKPILEKKSFSEVGQQLISEYNSIPEESRPPWDIEQLVTDLDDRHSLDTEARDRHFIANDYYYNDVFSWDGTQRSSWNGCNGRSTGRICDYHKIHDTIKGLKAAIEKREKAAARADVVARTKHVNDDLSSLIEQLRNETTVINEATTKLKELT